MTCCSGHAEREDDLNVPSVRVLVLRAPGTNCDRETEFAFQQVGAVVERQHVNRLLETPGHLREYQVLVVPGGFSYGDDVAAGAIFGGQLRHHLADALRQFHDAGGLILGICNGFQTLMKTDLLPGGGANGKASLALNESGVYEDRWVDLEVASASCVFLRGVERMQLPVAHAEGRFVCSDTSVLARLSARGQIALRYAPNGNVASASRAEEAADTDDRSHLAFPTNPNGSWGDVAALCDPTGRVLGLMPHPERHIDPTQHPQWTRGKADPSQSGLAVFRNAVEYFR